ncbi:MAG: glycerophosphodiester phosphodiesterase [Pseudomonadales bacterium]
MHSKSSIFSRFNRPMIFGHRGVPEEYQENTMSGFKRSVELGIDGVELDIFLSSDNRLVVFHDINTERLTGVRGRITEMTWEQLRELDIQKSINVGDRIITYAKTEKIALLEEVLEELHGKLLPIIEIKGGKPDYQQRHTGTKLARTIRRMGLIGNVAVTSSNFWSLLSLKHACPNIESGLTYSPDIVPGKSFRSSSLVGKLIEATFKNMSLNMFDRDTIERNHRRGLAIGAWTIFPQDSEWLGSQFNEAQQLDCIRNLNDQGIDYFITDDPARLQNVIKEL